MMERLVLVLTLVREQVERTLRGIVTVQKLYRGHRCHYRYRVRLVTAGVEAALSNGG